VRVISIVPLPEVSNGSAQWLDANGRFFRFWPDDLTRALGGYWADVPDGDICAGAFQSRYRC